jgi:hypothetical protein
MAYTVTWSMRSNSMQLITADGVKLKVGTHSEGEERKLFNALCGAGFGLAIVTSVVMKAFPISELGLTDGGIWTRRVMLPATGIEAAARVYADMHNLPPSLTITMVCMRSPPGSATPGTPALMLTGSYFGPSSEAEKACSALFDTRLTGQAMHSETELVPLADGNLPLKPLSANGGHKSFSSTFLDDIDAARIQESFKLWLAVGDMYKDALPTTLVFNKWDTKVIKAHGDSDVGTAKAFEHRTQSMVANAMLRCSTEQTRVAVEGFGREFLKIVRRGDPGPPKCIANNQRPGMDMEELYTRERLAELGCIKKLWDPTGVLWNPIVWEASSEMGERTSSVYGSLNR